LQVEFLKILGMMTDNRHLKPDRNGFFSPPDIIHNQVHLSTLLLNIIFEILPSSGKKNIETSQLLVRVNISLPHFRTAALLSLLFTFLYFIVSLTWKDAGLSEREFLKF
jgi:hypothetical protein